MQQPLHADQLLLIMQALANLDKIQIEPPFDADQLRERLRVLASPNKSQFEAKSIRDISARALDQEGLVSSSDASITGDLLPDFDFIIKSLSFDKSKTISRHIHPIALKFAQKHVKYFDSYVQSMIT